MPIYEYKCQVCGRKYELLQDVGEGPPEVCSCGSRGSLKKLLSAPMIQFKGDGWYVTDYAKKGGPDKEQARKEDHSTDKKSSEDKTTNSD